MKTIKLPVTAAGNVIVEPNGTTIALSFNHAPEIATILNSHDALVEALTTIANGHAGGEGAGFDMQEIAQKALKLAEGGK